MLITFRAGNNYLVEPDNKEELTAQIPVTDARMEKIKNLLPLLLLLDPGQACEFGARLDKAVIVYC